ncbi:hypothetical protein [Novosphingobium kaempferiae]|uniref:hypothetical protein n=1 Tax=Novosphingobium kaempferiae TaxID=2896849 RepID=UPI001E6382D0|nr:hypothetical protein [Novosphingobium kaempferiae]
MPSIADRKRLQRATNAAAKSKSKGISLEGGGNFHEDGIQIVAGVLNLLTFEYIASARERDDLSRLLPQISSAMPADGGVLVIRFVGERSDPSGGLFYEYIGLRIGPSGYSAADAIYTYERNKSAAEKEPSARSPDMCFPEDVAPKSPSAGATISAAPKGMDFQYEKEFADKYYQYQAKSSKNLRDAARITIGNYIFIDRKMLDQIRNNRH